MTTMTRPTLFCRSRYFRAEPVGEALTRVELVERLRLLWQGTQGPNERTVMAQALEIVIEAFGLKAERAEIFGDDVSRSSF